MNDQQLAHLSVLAALNKMMRGRYFDICTIDSAIKVLGCIPDGRAYDILRPLHCMHWQDMPEELRANVPGLVERCLSVPAHQFQLTAVPESTRQAILLATANLLGRPS